MTGYKEGMLNLLNVFGLQRLSRLSQFHIVLFYVQWFHVLLFHALQIGPSISRPSFSRPAFSAPSQLDPMFSLRLLAKNTELKISARRTD